MGTLLFDYQHYVQQNKRNTYRFEMKWGWVNYDKFNFWVNYAFKILYNMNSC